MAAGAEEGITWHTHTHTHTISELTVGEQAGTVVNHCDSPKTTSQLETSPSM